MIQIRINKEEWFIDRNTKGGFLDVSSIDPKIAFVQIDPSRANPRKIIEMNGDKEELIEFFDSIINNLKGL